ncbi:MAG: hypothetical protein ACJ77A_11260 [Actinomycetota bacterium]
MQHQVCEERRLARPGLAEHVQVVAGVLDGDGHRPLHPHVIALAEDLFDGGDGAASEQFVLSPKDERLPFHLEERLAPHPPPTRPAAACGGADPRVDEDSGWSVG